MVYRGEPLTEVPDVDLVSFTLARARERGNRAALIDGPTGRTVSYAELERAVQGFAAGLAARGFGPGDTLAISMPNSPEYVIAVYGALAAGGRVTPANPLYTVRELGFQLRDAGARMLVTHAEGADTARAAIEGTGCECLVVGEPGGAPLVEWMGDPAAAPRPSIAPSSDVAVIPYSSGTTGLPKGVMLSHRNLVANLLQMDTAWHTTPDEVLIAVLPFFHIYGLSVIVNLTLWSGGTLVTMPRFEIASYLALSQRHRVTRAYVVPPIALALAQHPDVAAHDLSSLRAIISAAAPLGGELARACAERLGCPVVQGYGMTELSPAVMLDSISAPGEPGTVGRLLPGTECRIVNPETRADAGPGEPGELLFRGPQVMLGYLGNPAATTATIDSHGWLATGDIGIEEGDGRFRIVDRVKELIKHKGFQIAPAEPEAVLITHPDVADCAVIGIPDDAAGEVPKALVVPATEELDPGEVMRFVADQVATYKQIRHVEFVDAIPRSPAGKILRRSLRENVSSFHAGVG